jgi:hypothetical protein
MPSAIGAESLVQVVKTYNMAREQINRGRLRAQIAIQSIDGGKVCIFCPAQVSDRLYQHIASKRILSSPPKHAMFGRYPQDELIVTSTLEKASVEIAEFVGSLPEICYEREVS